MRALVLLILCALCLSSSLAWAQDADHLWTEATERMAAGEDQEAVELLERLSQNFPDAPLADDALFLAGSLQEEKLGRPDAARDHYRRLLERFPDSRSALAAQRRLEALEAALGEGGEGAIPLARFSELLAGFPDRKLETSLAMGRQLVEEFPDWSELYRVQLWLGDAYRRQGDLARARPHYQAVRRGPAPEDARTQALLALTELQILHGAFAEATSNLDILRGAGIDDPGQLQAIDELDALHRRTHSRRRLVRYSYLVLALGLVVLLALLRRAAGSWRGLVTELRRPPVEVLYLLPLVGFLVIMALTGHQELGPAVSLIGGGTLVLTWLSAATLRATRPLTLLPALACAGISLLAALSLCYLAIYRSALVDLILTTVRFGPE